MNVGIPVPRSAIWLVGCCAAVLLNISQTPANAVSSEAIPGPVGKILEEAAPGGGKDDVQRFWFSGGELINVIAKVGGRPREFKVSGAEQLLWIGEPGSVAQGVPELPASALPETFDSLPEAVRSRVLTLIPDFQATEVFAIRGREIYYQLRGDSIRGGVQFTIKANGTLIAFDVDLDRDGLGDAFEVQNGWNPNSADTDNDGFPDLFEFRRKGDPGSADRHPQMLDVRIDRGSQVLIATVATFEDAAFFVEYRAPDREEWVRLGEALAGNGEEQDFVIPLGADGAPSALLRAGFTGDEEGAIPGDEERQDTDGECSVPDTLQGRKLTVGGRSLCFKSKTRGEEVQGGGGGMLVTPFGYTFRKTGECEARLTVNFNTASGFETTVIKLTFGSGGSASGEFAASTFEDGSEEEFDGDFTLSMNP